MAVSPDGNMLAVGGSDPSDCQIYHIEHRNGAHPRFTPAQAIVVCPAVDVHLGESQLRSAFFHRQQQACAAPGTPRLAVWDDMAYRQTYCDR